MQSLNPDQVRALLNEGVADAIDRQMNNDADRVFAGRMAQKLNIALARIQQLEAEAAYDSWRGDVDRQGGAFSDDEIARSLREQW